MIDEMIAGFLMFAGWKSRHGIQEAKRYTGAGLYP